MQLREIPSRPKAGAPLRFDMVEHGVFQNTVLRKLDAKSIDRLHLSRIDLVCGQQVVPHGEAPRFVLFLESGIASRTVLFEDGSQIETGVIGYESMIGSDSLFGRGHNLHGTFIQVAGTGFVCRIEDASREFARFETFHDVVLTCMQANYTQAAQLAGCNIKHDIIQRIPRWLLTCSDRLPDCNIRITHEMICNALGVSRPTVTISLTKLQDAGLLDCGRRRIRILNVEALRSHACECYRRMRINKSHPVSCFPEMPVRPISPAHGAPDHSLVGVLQ